MKKNNKPFSEVIESSLRRWLVQSWEWNQVPAFGSLVTIQDGPLTIFGIVYDIQTGSMDPVRYPFPYKKTHEELLREQPQIFEFLKTTFSCLTVGYQDKGKIVYQLAPEPPKIHSFIALASDETCKEFFYRNNFLHLLFNASEITHIDELLLAILKQYGKLNIATDEKIHEFINTYSLLTGNDYRRMKLFLQRAEQNITL